MINIKKEWRWMEDKNNKEVKDEGKSLKITTNSFVTDYKSSTPKEIWIDGVLANFIYGVLGGVVIVTITLRVDIAVLLAYLIYYFYLGKIVNRPKYVTDLGKFIVFPIPTAIGAYIGYKIGPFLSKLVQ